MPAQQKSCEGKLESLHCLVLPSWLVVLAMTPLGWQACQGKQSVSCWHIDYFELNLLKRQLVQGHSDPSSSSLKQGIKLPCKRYFPWPGKKTAFSSETGNLGWRKLYKAVTLVTSLI